MSAVLLWQQTSCLAVHRRMKIQVEEYTTKSYYNNILDDSLRFAWGFLSDYLCEDVSEKLKDLLGFVEINGLINRTVCFLCRIVDVVHEKPEVAEPNAKKSKTDSGPTDDYTLGSPGPNKASSISGSCLIKMRCCFHCRPKRNLPKPKNLSAK